MDATAKQVAESGGTFVSRTADVTSRDTCHQIIADAVREQGRLDVLGNVAGVIRMSHFAEMSEEDYRFMMGVNIDAYVWLSQAAIPHLIETGGNIVNIASNAGLMGQAYTVAYCTSKGAVVNFTKALAMEFMKSPIRVNAIAPAGTVTALANNVVFPDDPDWALVGRYTGMRDMAIARGHRGPVRIPGLARSAQYPWRDPVERRRRDRRLNGFEEIRNLLGSYTERMDAGRFTEVAELFREATMVDAVRRR